jgi:hypothetical protein
MMFYDNTTFWAGNTLIGPSVSHRGAMSPSPIFHGLGTRFDLADLIGYNLQRREKK